MLWVCNEDATVLLVWTTVYAETKFEGYRVDYCGLGRPMCVLTHHRERQADAAAVPLVDCLVKGTVDDCAVEG